MNKNFCALPWLHLHPYPSGKVFRCCAANKNPWKVGNLTTQTLDEIANSEEMNKTRYMMMNDIPVPECAECMDKERGGVESDRLFNNELYKDQIEDLVKKTNPDGTLNFKFKMLHMSIRHSNLCNFSCRMCVPRYSSVIAAEEGIYDWEHDKKTDKWTKMIYELPGTKNAVMDINTVRPNYLEELMTYLPDVINIAILGGESILIHDHWVILDKLIEIGRTDANVIMFTNLSKLHYKDKYIVDYIKKFNKFELYVSLDGSGPRAEIFRNGTVWSHIVKNLKTLRDNQIRPFVHTTVSAMNVWHLPDFQKYLIENDYFDATSTSYKLNILVRPNELNMQLLPNSYKAIVEEKIKKHQNWLNDVVKNSYLASGWDQVISYMYSEDKSHMFPKFLEFNKKLDDRRGQNMFDAFPELKDLPSLYTG